LQHARISQIVPAQKGKLLLAMFSLKEFGLFDPSTLVYKKIAIKPAGKISPTAEFRLWKDSKGEIYLNVQNYGILHYNEPENAFVDDHPFPFPAKWTVSLLGFFEHKQEQQYWFACDSGLCIYDSRSRQMRHRRNNPTNLEILNRKEIKDRLTNVYVDKQGRNWIFGLSKSGEEGQVKWCFASTGKNTLQKDTAGLNHGYAGTTEYKSFYETKEGELWIYGYNILLHYDKNNQRFDYVKNNTGNKNFDIDYESVFQVMEDKDGNIWIATNQGIYYTATGSANDAVDNITFNSKNGPTSINDILELPNEQIWFTSWRGGVTAIDKHLKKVENAVYRQPPPANWPMELKIAATHTLSIARQAATGNIWIGCNRGVLLIHNPSTKTTQYLHPAIFNNSVIDYIVEDKEGVMWLGLQSGKLIKYSNNNFEIVQDVATIIYKVFIDSDGWIWLATRGRGLFAIERNSGKILQHYTADDSSNRLYSNTGLDIEQLKNGLIAFGAGALHFIDKKTRKVSTIKYEDGLPSNTISRLRIDDKGFLWIITSNGLCRYNPGNHHITPYSRKDGVVLAEQTIAADYRTSKGDIIFGGSNSVVMFNPTAFSVVRQPANVTITDFKIFNRFLPLDSLLGNAAIRLNYDENSPSIYFASLNYRERDKLTYYYKLEGVENDWIKADRSYYVNYSLLPPGKYIFKIYCENIEGIKSAKTTELTLTIKPPYWRTWWFMSFLFFIVALLIYALHEARVKRLLAMEQLRNRVARDLHDDMGSTLSTINILTSMAINKVNIDIPKTSVYLHKIAEYSEKMMDVMDDIVWSIKPSNDSIHKITARMREFATNVLEAKEIEFEFKIDEEVSDVKLNMEARRDFFLVFKEAVNNAAKYSKASNVLIQVKMQYKKLMLVVKDDGIGFNIAEADGNGLGNMQKRAENVNGTVTIQSKQGEGTTVKLVIPITP
ncbi:MAG TPA: two-component regulator propeller domain-containing protein, partial [Segetibacter sp.]